MSSTDTEPATDETDPDDAVESDIVREGQLAELTDKLGDSIVASHLVPHRDLFVRVTRDDWARTASVARALGYHFFDFLSAVDWLPSPYGRYEDSVIDGGVGGGDDEFGAVEPGYTGGETRFQLIARVFDTDRKIGVHFRADLPDDDLRADTWIGVYAGANWHERETHEMFGITFAGHPYLENLYLPSGFEGFPLRKDFPLLARIVKPWPGIVDVEPMPEEDEAADTDEAATEDASDD